jgi:hypothetical protein
MKGRDFTFNTGSTIQVTWKPVDMQLKEGISKMFTFSILNTSVNNNAIDLIQ